MNREYIEDMILELAEIVKENRYLREENYHLRKQAKEDRERFDRMYSNSTNQVANLLNTVLEKC